MVSRGLLIQTADKTSLQDQQDLKITHLREVLKQDLILLLLAVLAAASAAAEEVQVVAEAAVVAEAEVTN